MRQMQMTFKRGLEAFDKGDYEIALKFWMPIAEEGYPEAQYNVGLMYYNGEGVPQDYNIAYEWFMLAAEQENVKRLDRVIKKAFNNFVVRANEI